jgi:hypothetical protein
LPMSTAVVGSVELSSTSRSRSVNRGSHTGLPNGVGNTFLQNV